MDRVKIALVGTGGIFHGWGGGSGHLPALPQVREGQLIALCDSNPENLERALIATRETYEAKAAEAQAAGNAPEAERLRDDAAQVRSHREVNLEAALEYIQEDELVEITPKVVRMRKRLLDASARKRESRKSAKS